MTERTEQIVREAPEIEAYKLGLLASGKALGDYGIQLPAQQIAGMTDLQRAALGQAGAGIGQYVPYVSGAGQTLGDARRFMQGSFGPTSPYGSGRRAAIAQQELAAGELPGTTGAFNPRTGTAAYFDPYEQQVVQQAMGDIQRQGNIARQQQAAQAVGAGAFGGSRSELGQQELNRNILEQQARTAAQLRSQGYQQSLGQAQQGFEQQQQRAQQAAQLRGGFGATLGTIAGQAGTLGLAGTEALGTLGLRQGALGELGQQLGQREGQYMFEMGKMGQAQQQAELEALRQSQLAQLYEPYQRVGFLSDVYKGAPSSQMAITGSTAPQASPAQQILGLGIAGLSAYGGAQRAGLFGFGT